MSWLYINSATRIIHVRKEEGQDRKHQHLPSGQKENVGAVNITPTFAFPPLPRRDFISHPFGNHDLF
jgi:hypothetical protein